MPAQTYNASILKAEAGGKRKQNWGQTQIRTTGLQAVQGAMLLCFGCEN